MTKKIKWLYKKEAKELGFTVKESEKGRTQARYSINEYQAELLELYRKGIDKREFVETMKKHDKDGNILSTTSKLQKKPINVPDGFEIIKVSKSETTGQEWVQYAKKKIENVEEFDIEAIIKKHISPVETVKVKSKKKDKDFDRLIVTDVHIGMDTNKYNNSMYPVNWSREDILEEAKYITSRTLEEKESNVIYIDDYGDLLDGFNAQTTRGGHELPQCMTNEEAFDCALQFKLDLVEPLVNHYGKIFVNNICNDNHSGAFGYFVNQAMKSILELKYPEKVTVTNHRKFINHYFVNDICFAITHGKDDKSLKFGFKPQLKPDGIEKIDQYLKNNGIYKKSDLVIFCKGDSHQALFDMCTSDDFYYFNYPAVSPSSQWVQNNFKKGRRGFFLESYKGTEIYIKPKLKK